MKNHAVGLTGLLGELQLNVPPPALRSEVGSTARRTIESPDEVTEIYPLNYQCGSIQDHLRFALRYEPLDLRVWHRVMEALPAETITNWVQGQPNSAYARRAWYLHERLTQRRLPLPDSRAPFADLADGERQIVWRSKHFRTPYSKRHRVRNNLLGVEGYCPLVRRTKVIKDRQERNYGTAVQALTLNLDASLFQRAADFLYRSETKSSYAIEGETPAPDREERFLAVLEHAGTEDIASEAALVLLQNQIVQDKRYAASGWRTIQNYVGRTRRYDYSEDVRYVCPAPGDLPDLMGKWLELVKKISRAEQSDIVPLAACAAFGFVYLHPFEDGNGRLHRFLIHQILAQAGYTPEGLIFPVSAVIQRRMKDYEAVLDRVSRLVNPGVQYTLDDANRMTVQNSTVDLYRYPDLTRHAEFLYECIAETLEKDWPEELSFLQQFDGVCQDVRAVVELPDNRLRLLAKLLLQNHGRLAAGKRSHFPELTDGELQRMEQAVTARMGVE
ncbi:MAG: Fic family protein [Bryobacterales bacterium]|nr:Fic family protein [Bryobacterales bacterium]